jgi:hypothetical protein
MTDSLLETVASMFQASILLQSEEKKSAVASEANGSTDPAELDSSQQFGYIPNRTPL